MLPLLQTCSTASGSFGVPVHLKLSSLTVTDGQTKCQNQTLEQYLRAYVVYQQDD